MEPSAELQLRGGPALLLSFITQRWLTSSAIYLSEAPQSHDSDTFRVFIFRWLFHIQGLPLAEWKNIVALAKLFKPGLSSVYHKETENKVEKRERG